MDAFFNRNREDMKNADFPIFMHFDIFTCFFEVKKESDGSRALF